MNKKLFKVLHSYGVILLESELQEIINIVMDEHGDAVKFAEWIHNKDCPYQKCFDLWLLKTDVWVPFITTQELYLLFKKQQEQL